MKMTMTAEEDN